MKKIILSVAIAGLAISCQKIQAGGNKGVLKMDKDVERYNDDVMSDEASAKVEQIQAAKTKPSADSAKTSVKTIEVKKDSAVGVKEASAMPAAGNK